MRIPKAWDIVAFNPTRILTKPLKKDLLYTFAAEAMIFLAGLLVYRVASDSMGEQGFSEYALGRRVLSFVQPVLLLGLGVGIPRYMVMAQTAGTGNSQKKYFISGLCILLVMIAFFSACTAIFPLAFSRLFFGNASYVYMIPSLAWMASGIMLHSLGYAYFRGRLKMAVANILQFINIGCIPVTVFFLIKEKALDYPLRAENVLLCTGILWCAVSSAFLLAALIRTGISLSGFFSSSSELLRYGVQRLPGDFSLIGILTLPAIFTAHLAGIREAGYVAFGVSMINIFGTSFAPIGLVLLPHASRMIAEKNMEGLKSRVVKFLRFTIFLSTAGIIVFEAAAVPLLRWYLPKIFSDELVHVARIIVTGALAYGPFVTVRSVVDSYYDRGVNAKNSFIAFVVFIIVSGTAWMLHWDYSFIVWGMVLSLYVLIFLTALELKKIFKP